MKKIKFLTLFLIAIFITSCEKQEDECYSCNESVNNWAQNNKAQIQKMNRYEIINLPGEKQRAAFRVLTPEKRKSVWNDKLNYLKSKNNTLEEVKLITYVESLLDKFTFDRELTDDEYYEIESKLLPLVKSAGWTKSKMVYAFGTLQNSKSESKNDFYSQKIAPPDDELDCNCRWGWCGSSVECEEDTCDETSLGCGLLGLGSCTKICGGNPNTP